MRDSRVKFIVLIAMFIAMVTVTTYIGIPWPTALGGYMHLGTLTSLIIALAFGKKYGALSGGIGMALFDFFSVLYAQWTIGTLIVRFIVGYVVGLIAFDSKRGAQGTSLIRNIIAIVVGAAIMIVGYFLYEAIFLGGIAAAFASITGNAIQFILGLAALFFVPIIKKLDLEV